MSVISSKCRPLVLAQVAETSLSPAASAVSAVSADARRWCGLAVGSLVVAGLLSLAVVIGRLPVISRIIDDPLFFKRCLVVHVDLSLSVWFYGFIASLLALRFSKGAGLLGRLGFGISVAGVVAMLAGALSRGAQPVLSNYIPMIDHPLFLSGIALFFLGVMLFFLTELSRSSRGANGVLPPATMIGLQASALMVALASVTFLSALVGLPDGLDTATFYEFVIWGAGHALQVANVCAMTAVWLWALEKATDRPVMSGKAALWVFGILIVPHFALPLLTSRGTLDSLYHSGATELMRWGIFPVMVGVLGFGIRHLVRFKGERSLSQRVAMAGFISSASLTALGVVLGACIRGSTTLVPAHYHASLGGVTVAFMTAAYLIASAVKGTEGLSDRVWTGARKQLVLFGIGQAVFAIGFGIGGVYGLGRKTYASEQHVRGLGEYIGLSTMGIGGLVAMAGGLWFLFLILREMRTWWGRRSNNAPLVGAVAPEL